jgi:hypothetical protein
MNVIKVYGGLGNQLFQYAFGKAMMHNGIPVRYDLSYFERKHDPDRHYSLDKFNTTNIKLGSLGSGKEMNEVRLKYVQNIQYIKMDKCDFYGYWQHPAYFKEIISTLVEELKVRKDLYTDEFIDLRQQMIINSSTSMHVRRGDYVSLNGHYVLSLEYYLKAVEHVAGQVYVFSDDVPWCKKNLPAEFIYVNLNEYLSFDLMRVCKNNIISNSTFSWWAAFLNDNQNKKVISPVQWRKDKNDPAWKDEEFKRPDDRWIQIDSPGTITE